MTLLRRIDSRLARFDKRLRKVEAKSRTAKVRIPKATKPDEPEELWVTDIFPPITERLEGWNQDRRTLLRAEDANVLAASH